MAMNMYRTKSANVDVSQVVGTLSSDGSKVTYNDENGEEQTVTVSDFLSPFKGAKIEMTVIEVSS